MENIYFEKEKVIHTLHMKYRPKILLQIIKSMLSLIPLPIAILIVVEMYSLNLIHSTILDFESAVYESVVAETEDIFESIYTVVYDLKYDNQLKEYFNESSKDSLQTYNAYKVLETARIKNGYIEEIAAYIAHRDFVLSTKSSMDSKNYHASFYNNSYDEWIEEISGGKEICFGISIQEVSGETVFITNVILDDKNVVKLIIKVKEQNILEVLKRICVHEKDQVFLLYNNQMLMSTRGETDDMLAEQLSQHYYEGSKEFQIDNLTYQLQIRSVFPKNMFLVYAMPENVWYSSVRKANIFGAAMVIVCCIVLLVSILIVSYRNYMPIKRLIAVLSDNERNVSKISYDNLEICAKQFRNEKKQILLKMKEYERNIKELYLEKLLTSDFNVYIAEEQIETWGFSGKYFIVLLYIFVGADMEQEKSNEVMYCKEILQTYITKYLSGVVCCYLMEKDGKVYCILNGDGESPKEFYDNVNTQNLYMIEKLAKVEFLYCNNYMSRCFVNLEDIYLGYCEVNKIYQKNTLEYEAAQMNTYTSKKTQEMIQSMLSDVNLSVASLAENLNISPAHLSRIFKRNTGVGVLEYIHQSRVKRAKELLEKEDELMLKEVAEMVGFANQATFIRVFKNYEGITPGQFKERMLMQKK